MDELIRAHAVIRGKVQGVGFRAFAQYHATQHQLHGWVQNRDDGGVELEIEGPKLSVEKFLQVLHQGPSLGKVHQVMVDWKEPDRQTDGFHIRRSSQ